VALAQLETQAMQVHQVTLEIQETTG